MSVLDKLPLHDTLKLRLAETMTALTEILRAPMESLLDWSREVPPRAAGWAELLAVSTCLRVLYILAPGGQSGAQLDGRPGCMIIQLAQFGSQYGHNDEIRLYVTAKNADTEIQPEQVVGAELWVSVGYGRQNEVGLYIRSVSGETPLVTVRDGLNNRNRAVQGFDQAHPDYDVGRLYVNHGPLEAGVAEKIPHVPAEAWMYNVTSAHVRVTQLLAQPALLSAVDELFCMARELTAESPRPGMPAELVNLLISEVSRCFSPISIAAQEEITSRVHRLNTVHLASDPFVTQARMNKVEVSSEFFLSAESDRAVFTSSGLFVRMSRPAAVEGQVLGLTVHMQEQMDVVAMYNESTGGRVAWRKALANPQPGTEHAPVVLPSSVKH